MLDRISLEGNLVQDGDLCSFGEGEFGTSPGALFESWIKCLAWIQQSSVFSVSAWGQKCWSQCCGDEFPFPEWHVSWAPSELCAPVRSLCGYWGSYPSPLIPVFLLPGLWVWRRPGWRVWWQTSWLASRSCSSLSLFSGFQNQSSTASSSTLHWPPLMGTSSLRGWLCCSRNR